MTMCTAGYFQKRIGLWGSSKKISNSWYGECGKCAFPCSQCKKCDINKDKTCVKCPAADAAKEKKAQKSAFQKCMREAKKNDPSPNYCLACDQSGFFPKLLIDVENVKDFVLNQRGMAENKAYTVPILLTQLPKYSNALSYETALRDEFEGDAQTLKDFLDSKIKTSKGAVFRTDIGMKMPDDLKDFKIETDKTTYRQLFVFQYQQFNFP